MGGKFFKDQEGKSLCERIPTGTIPLLTEQIILNFAVFFDKIKMVISDNALQTKEDHGDLDFVCLKNKDSLFLLRLYCDSRGIQYGHNGNMEHLRFPLDGHFYQIDFILAKDKLEYETELFFYSQEISFNSLIGQFARSIGYKFSTQGLLLHITDSRKQNYYVPMTRELPTILKLLCLEMPDKLQDLYASPEYFALWLTSSPRYDSSLMFGAENKNSHRDAKRDDFCSRVWNELHRIKKIASIPQSRIDFSRNDFNLEQALLFEKEILGEDIIEDVLSLCEEKRKFAEPVIRGDILLEMGFKPGPIMKEIIQDVSQKFAVGNDLEEIKSYLRKKYADNISG
jgi:hypothetical protein